MTITILTTGSRGDTQPYLALGLALKKVGYHVRIAAFENYKDFVDSFGFEFYPIRGDVSKVTASDSARGARTADNPLKLLLSFNKLQSLVFDLQEDFFNACIGADVVVYHPGAAIGYYAAQHLNIPAILATPFPMTPTREYPALIFYDSIRLGKSYNHITHKIFEQIMWLASRSPIKHFWKQKFDCLPQGFGSPFSRQNTHRFPTIISCSNHVFPRPPDWPEHVYNTGYWFIDYEAGWQPPTELLDFLERGAPPVYAGFGSIGDPALAVQTTALVIAALKRCGKRGVLATGWNGLSTIGDLPEDIYILESAPHAWLFPRMAVVVHHGGAGTTAAGLRAGIPSVIIPSSNDQFAWGRRVYELGAGSKPIPREKLSAESLAQAINFALKSEIVTVSEALGSKIQTETGAENAAKIIIACKEHRT